MIQLELDFDDVDDERRHLRIHTGFFKGVDNFKTMEARALIREILAGGFQLGGYLSFFTTNNRANDAPYHNKYHSYCMVLNCYEGALHEKLNYDEKRALLCAALFHDFNHSAGEEADRWNIEQAINGLNIATGCIDHPLTEAQFEQAVRLIEVTEYPYLHVPKTVSEKIIRDADLMQAYENDPVLLKKQYRGLQTEVERRRNMTFTHQEFADGQLEWLNREVKWYTTWAQRKAVVLDWEATKIRLHATLSGAGR